VPLEWSSPAWLAALVLVVAFVAVWRHWPAPFGARQRRAALLARSVVVIALVLALAGPQFSYRSSTQTLVVAADLSASTATARAQETTDVQELAATLPARDQMGVVSFGQDALVEDPPEHGLQFTGFSTSPGDNFTDIESALRLAASVVAPGTRRHVLLVSDGRQNVGDGIGEAQALRAAGARVDVLPLQVPLGPDVRVDSVDMPATVPPSTRALATAVLVSNETTPTEVVWTLDNGQVVSDTTVTVHPGVTELHALLPPARPGLHEVKVQISPERDSVPGNGVGEALFQVLGRQQVLVVAGQPGAGRNVAAALAAAGIATDVVAPYQVPISVAGVARWQSVALVDVSAASLGYQRMEAIAEATRDLGVGLAAFGGPGTYGPGGWSGTPLEQALPINMKIPSPKAKPPVAVMLVLETVESTTGDMVVRAACNQLVANLSPQDLVGVTNGATGVVVPLQPVGNGRKLEQEIAAIPDFGDPPSYVPYLQDAAAALAGHPQATKYIVMMGDGDADFPLPTPQFMAGIVHQGITVSVIGADVHGSPLYMSYMAAIAAEGDGRFYDSESAYELPSIFFDESEVQLQPWVVQERFRVVAGAASPALDGIDPSALPPLFGYVAATPKAASQVVLSGPNADPILAQWQYGLGTAEAWTSDTQGRWTAELLRSPLGGKLLAGIVASTLPLAADPDLSVSAQVEGDEAHLVAQVTAAPSDASAVAHVVGPDGQAADVPLVETAPGRFEGDISTSEVGSYIMRVQVSAGGRALHAATVGVAVAYSPELRYMGTDTAFLAEVARAGGGAVLSSPRQAIAQPVPAVDLTQPLWGALLVLAIILVPVDVALRRLNLSRRQVALPLGADHATGGPLPATGPGTGDGGAGGPGDGPGKGRKGGPEPPAGPASEDDQALATRLLERLRQ
jgi:hypothetical protein